MVFFPIFSAMSTQAQTFCSYCGNSFIAKDHRQRFCSTRCLKLFATKYQLPIAEEFSLSEELTKLQQQLQQSPIPDEKLTKEALIVFYDSVFTQLTRVVKWINTQALQQEEQTENPSVPQLKHKLKTVLEKAAELKKENSQLKKRIRLLEQQDSILAKTLLNIHEQDSIEEVRKSFKTKAKFVHPDVFDGGDSFFISLQLAYELLSSKAKAVSTSNQS
jgi:ribosomal protein S27AE